MKLTQTDSGGYHCGSCCDCDYGLGFDFSTWRTTASEKSRPNQSANATEIGTHATRKVSEIPIQIEIGIGNGNGSPTGNGTEIAIGNATGNEIENLTATGTGTGNANASGSVTESASVIRTGSEIANGFRCDSNCGIRSGCDFDWKTLIYDFDAMHCDFSASQFHWRQRMLPSRCDFYRDWPLHGCAVMYCYWLVTHYGD